MRKKVLLLVLIPILLLSFTACDKKKKVEKEKDDRKSIVLKDSGFGYKTTFKYDKKDDYSDVEEEKSGKSTQISFDNEDLDLEFEMYYTSMSSDSYKTTEEARSKQKYYKKYKFGKYNAYAYGEYDSGLYMNILLETTDDNTANILFVSIDRLDNDKEKIVSDLVAGKEVQALFNTIKVEKYKG